MDATMRLVMLVALGLCIGGRGALAEGMTAAEPGSGDRSASAVAAGTADRRPDLQTFIARLRATRRPIAPVDCRMVVPPESTADSVCVRRPDAGTHYTLRILEPPASARTPGTAGAASSLR
jgi:hypothetical protein